MHIKQNFQMAVKDVAPAGDGSKSVTITGYASTSDVDRYNDIVKPEAFKDALVSYLKNPVLLRSHNADRPVGTVTSAVIDGKGLKITATVMDEQTAGEVSDGRMRALSIGYIPLESSLEHEDGTPFNAEKDSVWDPKLVRVINKLDLAEISIVAVPANGNALFTLQKSLKKHFNVLMTKGLAVARKDGELPENEIDPDTAQPTTEPLEEEPATDAPAEPVAVAPGAEVTEPAQEEVVEPVAPSEEVKPEEAKAVEPETPAEPAPVDAPVDAPNETQKPNTATQDGENAGETPAPVATEPSGDAAEEVTEPKVEPESGEEKAFLISAKTAALLPELVQGKVAVVDEKAAEIPAEFAAFTRKLLSMSIAQEAEIKKLGEKIAKTPTKEALRVTGQFDGRPQEDGGAKEKKDTPFLNMLFNSAKKT